MRSITPSNWRTFLNHFKQQMLACYFFTVETLGLRTVYVVFFIELHTRRVYFAGCTQHPSSFWIAQQARQLCWTLHEQQTAFRYLIHDRDTKFSAAFEDIFRAESIKSIRTPVRAPNANAIAERWIRTVRQECLNHFLILNERHAASAENTNRTTTKT